MKELRNEIIKNNILSITEINSDLYQPVLILICDNDQLDYNKFITNIIKIIIDIYLSIDK